MLGYFAELPDEFQWAYWTRAASRVPAGHHTAIESACGQVEAEMNAHRSRLAGLAKKQKAETRRAEEDWNDLDAAQRIHESGHALEQHTEGSLDDLEGWVRATELFARDERSTAKTKAAARDRRELLNRALDETLGWDERNNALWHLENKRNLDAMTGELGDGGKRIDLGTYEDDGEVQPVEAAHIAEVQDAEEEMGWAQHRRESARRFRSGGPISKPGRPADRLGNDAEAIHETFERKAHERGYEPEKFKAQSRGPAKDAVEEKRRRELAEVVYEMRWEGAKQAAIGQEINRTKAAILALERIGKLASE